MGWQWDVFYYTPAKYFFKALHAWLMAEEKKKKELFEIVRMHSTTILNSFVKKALKPTDVMTFSWDKKELKKTVEDNKELMDKWISDLASRNKK